MTTLDDFYQSVVTQDTHKRLQVYPELVTHLSTPRSSLFCDDMDHFIDGLLGWMNSSNFKISLAGLEVLSLLAERMGEIFRIHVTSVLPPLINRLGDNHDEVREQAQTLILRLMSSVANPQFIFERMMGGFNHKLWRVREEVLLCLQSVLNTYGARSLQLSKLVPSIIKLLEDSNSQVREAAIATLVEIYRHVGEKVRVDLCRKGLPPARLNPILDRFDVVKERGDMLVSDEMSE